MAQNSPQIAGVMVQSTKSESLEQRLFPGQQVFIEKTGDIVKVNGRYEVTRLPDGSYQITAMTAVREPTPGRLDALFGAQDEVPQFEKLVTKRALQREYSVIYGAFPPAAADARSGTYPRVGQPNPRGLPIPPTGQFSMQVSPFLDLLNTYLAAGYTLVGGLTGPGPDGRVYQSVTIDKEVDNHEWIMITKRCFGGMA